MKKRAAGLTLAVVTAAVVLAGCTAPPVTPVDTTLTVGIGTPPISLDPLRAAVGTSRWFEDPAYTSVLDINDDGEVVAGLADEWGYEGEGNTEFSFTLREGLEFSDGTPVTAQAVVDSYDYFIANGSGPGRPPFLGITAEAVDDLTVHLTSATPNPVIDQMLGGNYYAFTPISPAGLADDEARARETFGVGPYVLDSEATIPDNTYVYVKNDNYYDPDVAQYERIEIKVIADQAQLVQALNTGQVEVIQVDPNVVSTLGDEHQLLERAALWVGLIIVDRNGALVPAFADERVRQALAMSIDRTAIAQASAGEFGQPAVQFATDGDPSYGYDPELEELFPYDPDAARELLAEAGYPDGFSFTVLYQGPSQADTKLVQALAAAFAEIGVTMELKAEPEFGAWVTDFTSLQYPATIFGGGGTSMFFATQGYFLPNGIFNIFNIDDPEVTALYTELSLAGGDEVGEKARELNRLVTEKALSIPVYTTTSLYAVAPTVEGVAWLGAGPDINSIIRWSPAD